MVTRRLPLFLLTAVVALLPIQVARAQAPGGIRGQVLDKDGQPLPTARVLITNQALGVKQATVTDAKGEYRVAPLPPGKGYSVEIDFPEMAKTVVPDVEVAPNRLMVVSVTLRPSSEMKETIKVTAQTDVVNTESTTTTTKISSEFIDALPILGRNYQDVLTLAPGVSDVNGDGNPNIHGARDVDTVTLVDGVSTVDPLTGQRGQELNINSIQEIEVKTSGASAEYGRAQGGFIDVQTKSGGNDFEGSFRFDWRGNVLDGQGAGIDNPQLHGGLGEHGLRDLTFNDLYPQLTVGGPIRKDKAWYFVALEYQQEQTPVNALTQAFVRTAKQKRLFGKITWDVSTNHKLVFTATFDPQSYDNLGLDSFTALESGFTQHRGGRNFVLTHRVMLSPNMFLETKGQDFISSPDQVPTLNPDTNGNGVLFVDRNNNHFIDASESDPGEDYDNDGKFDVFEDLNRNKVLDTDKRCLTEGIGCGEDRDRDGRLTLSGSKNSSGGCEGTLREDKDCDGRLDFIDEDPNGNGIVDPGEPGDIDNDGILERGTEDRNHNQVLDDRPFVLVGDQKVIKDAAGNILGYDDTYPYEEFHPLPADQVYSQDQRTLRTSGPFLQDYTGDRGRQTLRQDLSIFVPDWHGQHDLKMGYAIEREHYSQTTNLRPWYLPNLAPPTSNSFVPTIGVVLPAENQVNNSAKSLNGSLYVDDVYKPLPNLTVHLGVRFEREATDSFGYTQFDPQAERALFDRLNGLSGHEQQPEDVVGNNDGIDQLGYCADALFSGYAGGCTQAATSSNAYLATLDRTLTKVKLSRLTQHHTSTELVAGSLANLFPDAKVTLPDGTVVIDRDLLRQQGAVFQEEEPFRITNNNLSPRLAVSWDPWADSKTKLVATWGRFYDKLFLDSIIQEEGPDTITRYYRKDTDGVTAAGIPDGGIGAPISKAPPSASQVDRGLQTPFTDEWTVGFERELAPEISVRVTYINRAGRLGLQDRDINHEVRCCSASGGLIDLQGRLTFGSGQSSSATPSPDGAPDLYIRNFFFNQVLRIGNYNTSTYHGIEVQVTKRLSRKWQMDASYTYSRARGFAENFQSILGDDPASVPYEYGYLNFDQRHVIRFNGTTYLPGDWTLGSVIQWSSGLPYSVVTQKFDLDNFTYPQFRLLFGQIGNTATESGVFFPERRNSRRNDSILNINVQATKAFVMGRFNSKLFLAVDNLLNRDDLTITQYQPAQPNRGGALQLIATRKFGRRWQIGLQFEF